MSLPSPALLVDWKARLASGDLAVARELVAHLDALIDIAREIERGARGVLAAEAAALEKRLADVAAFGGECRTCHNAEARAVLARLTRLAQP